MRYRTYPKWGFALVSAMSGFGDIADVIASGSERPFVAICGRLPVGKGCFDGDAELVGAAMCPAC